MSARSTILHLIYSLDSGGCENMLLRTLPEMRAFTHVVVTLNRPGELADRFSEKGITVRNIGWRGVADLTRLKQLTSVIREFQPVVIMTYLFHADMIGRCYLQRHTTIPVVPFLRTTYNDRAYWIPRLAERATKRLVPHYLANSQAVKEYYHSRLGVPSSRITVIPNGLDLSVFDRASGESVRQELNIPESSLVVTCVANLAINKGHRYLLEAFAAFANDYPHRHLILVGEGGERAALEQQAAHYECRERVHFLGRRHDVPTILKASDIFVLPTLFEGMSNAILEAMATELGVIVTDIPENRAILTHEKNGLLVPPATVSLLVQALNGLADDTEKRKRLGRVARQTIADHFDLRVVSRQWESKLQELSHGA